MTLSESQPSIASLTREISFLTEVKQHWEAETSEALGPIQALRDYASMLRTSASRAEAAAAVLQEEYTHRVGALFDEPVDKLRREIRAMRDDFERMLREDIVSPSPSQSVIPERLPP